MHAKASGKTSTLIVLLKIECNQLHAIWWLTKLPYWKYYDSFEGRYTRAAIEYNFSSNIENSYKDHGAIYFDQDVINKKHQ